MSGAAEPRAPSPFDGLDDFLRSFGQTEHAWAALDGAEGDAGAVMAAAAQAAHSSPVQVRAADMLAALERADEARALLLRAMTLDGPAATVQISYARLLRAKGDPAGARAWYRSGLTRARPDAALMLDYAVLEQDLGDPEAATRVAEAARSLRLAGVAGMIAVGRRLAALDRADLAGIALAAAFERGHRDPLLLTEIVAAGAGAAASLSAPLDAAIPGGPTIRGVAATMCAHAKLVGSLDREPCAASARAREASPAWVPFDRLERFLRERIDRREPFSWVRLGDGEARFLLHARPELRGPLNDDEVHAIVDLIWSIWFGEPFVRADPARVTAMARMFEEAIANADLLGVSSAERLAGDESHRGYCAALERYLQTLPVGHGRCFTDAVFNTRLHEADAFLGRLIGGLDFVGVIGPHPGLATRLQRHLGIGQVASYDIPGEGRLARPEEYQTRGQHFPSAYDRLMTDLSVPFQGAVFLVAGGLLGKIYCDRIRTLGGIALDIGALADAWMGYNTRRGPLDRSMRAVLPS